MQRGPIMQLDQMKPRQMKPRQNGSEGRYALRPDRVAGEFCRLPAEVQSLVRLCDGTRNLAELRRASDLPPQVFDLVLNKLALLGTSSRSSGRASSIAAA